KEKGIRESIIEEAMQHFSFQEQKEHIKRWIEKQNKKREANRAFIDKLRQQLQQKGYSLDVIQEGMKEVELPYEEEEEWEAIQFHGNKIVKKYEERYNGWEFIQRVKQ